MRNNRTQRLPWVVLSIFAALFTLYYLTSSGGDESVRVGGEARPVRDNTPRHFVPLDSQIKISPDVFRERATKIHERRESMTPQEAVKLRERCYQYTQHDQVSTDRPPLSRQNSHAP